MFLSSASSSLLRLVSSSSIPCSSAFILASNFSTANPAAEALRGKGVNKIGVIGLGLMGHGVVQVTAQSGFDVVAVETSQQALDSGLARIKESSIKLATKQLQKGLLTPQQADSITKESIARITPSLNLSALSSCDFIIEAVVENMDLKKKLHADLGKLAKKSAILASNTSSLSVIDMAVASGRPSQFVGLHFFNPVQLMALVEVIKTDKTDPAIFDTALTFGKAIGKTPVTCKDTPGFVVNRLLVPYLIQAVLMFERGDASRNDIDTAMKLGAGHPMGPLQLADYTGLDTCLYIAEGWVKNYPKERAFVVPNLLKKMVAEGKLGRKSGEGFYKWKGDKIVE